MSNHREYWFGYHSLPLAKMAWGCRAIFKPSASYPLDILHDRQGHHYSDDQQAEYEQFASFINDQVLPRLQEWAKWFSPDDKDVLTLHFEWPHDSSLLVVVQGSPNVSCGYFYAAASLVPKESAPPVQLPPGYMTEQRRLAMMQKLDAERRKNEQRQRGLVKAVRDHEKNRRANFAATFSKAPFKKAGETLQKGDGVFVYANQGDREGLVLAVLDNRALIEYQMPRGRKFLRIIACDDQADCGSVSRMNIPKKWHEAMKD